LCTNVFYNKKRLKNNNKSLLLKNVKNENNENVKKRFYIYGSYVAHGRAMFLQLCRAFPTYVHQTLPQTVGPLWRQRVSQTQQALAVFNTAIHTFRLQRFHHRCKSAGEKKLKNILKKVIKTFVCYNHRGTTSNKTRRYRYRDNRKIATGK